MDTQWKKKRENFEGKSSKKPKIENFKNIPLFENIYEKNPLSFNDTTIIEGYTDQEQCNIDLAMEAEMQNIGSRLDSTHITSETLSQGITDALSKINDFDNMPYNNASIINNGMNLTVDTSTPIITSSDTKSSANQIKTAIRSFINVIKIVLTKLFGIFSFINQLIQYSILNYHIYYTQLMTNIASGLTGGTATQGELSIFMNESQRLITILLLWVFVYNWYYVTFFLDIGKKLSFSTDKLEKDYGLLNMLFMPSIKVVYVVNNFLVKFIPEVKEYFKLSKGIIFVLLVIIFWILTATNFQSSLIYDFFASLNYLNFFKSVEFKRGPSIVTIFVSAIVFYYGIKHFIGGLITKYFYEISIAGGGWSFLIGAGLLFISFLLYAAYLLFVNIPLGVVFIFTYLIGYTFFAIIGYEGWDCFYMITAISEDISLLSVEPKGTVCDEINYFTFANFPKWVYKKIKQGCSFILKYIFEILVISNLLGGISVYISNYKSILSEKKAMYGIGNSSSVARAAFKNLFTWLILINILIIIIMGIVMNQKIKIYNSINSKFHKKINVDSATVPPADQMQIQMKNTNQLGRNKYVINPMAGAGSMGLETNPANMSNALSTPVNVLNPVITSANVLNPVITPANVLNPVTAPIIETAPVNISNPVTNPIIETIVDNTSLPHTSTLSDI